MPDVFGTQNSPPDPIKYTLPDGAGRVRTRALTDSQAEGRGFESPFPLQTNKIKAPSDVVSTIRAQKAEGRGFESRFLLHTQSLTEQGVPHGLLIPLSARP